MTRRSADHGFQGAGATPVGQDFDLIRWVEEGHAPNKIIAKNGDTSGQIIRTRPLFPYPQVTRYKGSGSTDEAANFESALPRQ
jgi:hypothetical protein